jgi:hypothetical protein
VDTRAYPIMNSFVTRTVLLADCEVKNNSVSRPHPGTRSTPTIP